MIYLRYKSSKIIVAIVTLLSLLSLSLTFKQKKVIQPIKFNHKAHIEAEEMECSDCHIKVKESAHATLPLINICIDCHSEPPEELKEESREEEEKVRQYNQANKQIPWVKVNRMPGHVYFSHKAHVSWANMKCENCHRDYTKVEEPVSEPDVKLGMYDCIQCHLKEKAEVDCYTCHR